MRSFGGILRWGCVLTALAAALGADRETADSKLQESKAALASGDYQRAIASAEAAEELFSKTGDLRRQAQCANSAGLGRLYRSEYAEALASFTRALSMNRQIGDAEAEITVENNIGNIRFFQGRYLEAVQWYETALARAQQTTGQPWSLRRRQLTLVNIGVVYEQLGQNQRALDFYRQARVTPSGLPPAEQAQLLSNLGTLYRRLGDPVRAFETYEAAERAFANEKHTDGEIHILHNIGILMTLDYFDLRRAYKAFTDAIRLAEQTGNRRQAVLGRLFRGEALQREGRLDQAAEDFTAALSGADQIGGVEERWTAQFALGKIAEQEGRRDEAASHYEAAVRTIESVRARLGRASLKSDFLAGKRDVYDALIALRIEDKTPDVKALFALIEQARSRNLQDALRPDSPVTLESIQSKLGQRVLVEYWLGPRGGAALWASSRESGIVPVRITPDRATAIARGIQQDDWRPWSDAGGEALLSALPIGAASRLLIVPDGALSRIPFEALAQGGRLLVQSATVSYLPSASVLLREHRPSGFAFPWQKLLVAFGDPVPPDSAVPLSAAEEVRPLPYAAAELESIARVMPGESRIEARQRNLKSQLPSDAPVLHLATHAVADTTDANRSRILFTREPGKPGSEYLFLREVQGLNFARTELVTLSACDTEGGVIARGEGVLSFSRAFLAAGASAAVTTLWRVADQPTAEFMTQFYARLGNGQPKAEALRGAKLSFLREGKELGHPRFWAAYVLNGEGDLALPRAYSWRTLLMALAILPVLVWLAVSMRRLGLERARRNRV